MLDRTMFRLRTLGAVALEGSTGALAGAATQRRRLALLTLLAASGERGMSRDKIVAYLWPESDAERGRHVLAQAIYCGGDRTGARGEARGLVPGGARARRGVGSGGGLMS